MPSTRKYILLLALVVSIAAFIAGCSDLYYYGQAINGQLTILSRSRPISDILEDKKESKKLKHRLRFVEDIKEFAVDSLYLPAGGDYADYVTIENSSVIYSVFAAPEFSLTPKSWCFPVVGCVVYRGYFSEKSAKDEAVKLDLEGYDAYVAGVPAFSTLGWFDDPVLSTFVYWSDAWLAGLIFHELAHQVVYIPNDSAFNESFARAVEEAGVRLFLKTTKRDKEWSRYVVHGGRKLEFYDLLKKYRIKLNDLYESKVDEETMREQKNALLDELRNDYEQLKVNWKGYSGFDPWFDSPVNNARFVSVSTYEDLLPGFQSLLKQNNNDLKAFYQACRDLKSKSKQERHNYLLSLINK